MSDSGEPRRPGRVHRTPVGCTTDEHPRLDRIQNGISLTSGILAGLALVLMAVLACVEVFSRAIFEQPLGWNVAFTERYLLVGGAFFGIVTAYRTNAHVAVTSLFGALPVRAQKSVQIGTHAAVAIIFGLLFWFGLQAAMTAAALGEIPPKGATELPIPEWIWRSFVPLGSLMGMTIAVIDLWRELSSPWSLLTTDYDRDDDIGEDAR